ncbi:hypothetical protein EMEDMD4_380048 [Sinorhizobium medicae]|uniref:Uncharacterized protein n=1 Tax=Sinorhizobium medicae TaxID=110321 RepID=A0A508WY48_9HYPH|nr:hypothetical protein EMEDMD4_380048 [Sinorhizobium medicae]
MKKTAHVFPSLPEEPADCRNVSALEKPGGLIMGDNTALVEENDAFGQRPHVIGMMRDHQYRIAFLLVQIADETTHLRPQAGIERRERLVEQEYRPVPYESPGERYPLTFPARQGRGKAAAESGEAHPAERILHLHALGRAEPQRRADAEADIGGHVKMREKVMLLEDDGDRAFRRWAASHLLAENADLSTIGRLEAGNDVEECRLARTGCAGDRDDTARGNGAVEGERRRVKAYLDAPEGESGGNHAPLPSGSSPAVPSTVRTRQRRPRNSASPAASAVR